MTLDKDIFTPNNWPSDLLGMKELDTLLRCGICFEFVNTAMMVKTCSHNYCSLCIRQYLTFKTECPTCRSNAVEQELVNNRLVDDVIAAFKTARPSVLKLCGQEPNDAAQKTREDSSRTNLDPALGVTATKGTSTIGKMFAKSTQKLSNITSPFSKKTLCSQKNTPRVKLHSISSGSESDDFLVAEKRELRRGTKRKNCAMSDSDDNIVLCESDSDSDFEMKKTSSVKERKSGLGSVVKNRTRSPECSLDASPQSPVFGASLQVHQDMGVVEKEFGSHSNTGKSSTQETRSLAAEPNLSSDKDTYTSFTSLKETATKIARTPLYSSKIRLQKPTSSTDESEDSKNWWKSPPHPPASQVTSTDRATDGSRVSCPVCGVSIPQRSVNLHLDQCLSREEKKESLRSNTPTRRKHLPKLVYHLMSDSDIRKRLAEVGLPTQGNKQKLVSLHKEYTLRYNSQCDALKPKSTAEIVKEMLRADSTKSKVALSSQKSAPQKLQVTKSSSSGAVKAAQKSYIQQHRTQFKELIADIRRRMKENPPAKKATTSTEEPVKNNLESAFGNPMKTTTSEIDQRNCVTDILDKSDVNSKTQNKEKNSVTNTNILSSKYFESTQNSCKSFGKATVESLDLVSDDDTRDSFKIPGVPKAKAGAVPKTDNDSDSNISTLVPNNDDQVSLGSSINSVTFFTQKSHPDRQAPEFPDTSNDSLFAEESLMHYRFTGSQDSGTIHGVPAHGHMQDDETAPGHMQNADGHILDSETIAMCIEGGSGHIANVNTSGQEFLEINNQRNRNRKPLYEMDILSEGTLGSSLLSGQFNGIKQLSGEPQSSDDGAQVIGKTQGFLTTELSHLLDVKESTLVSQASPALPPTEEISIQGVKDAQKDTNQNNKDKNLLKGRKSNRRSLKRKTSKDSLNERPKRKRTEAVTPNEDELVNGKGGKTQERKMSKRPKSGNKKTNKKEETDRTPIPVCDLNNTESTLKPRRSRKGKNKAVDFME